MKNSIKKPLSVILALLMALSCLAVGGVSAYAANPATCTTVNFQGVEADSNIPAFLNQINYYRALNNAAPLTYADSQLTAMAKSRAKDLVANKNPGITAANDDLIQSYIAGGMDEIVYSNYGVPDAYSIISQLNSSIPSYLTDAIKAVGIGCFTVNNYSYTVIILSVLNTAVPFTDYTDKTVTASIYVDVTNITLGWTTYRDSSKYGFVRVQPYCYFGNCPVKVNLSASDFNIISSDSKIVKVNGDGLFPKKSGNATVTVSFKANNAIASSDVLTASTQTAKGSIKSLSSKKKKKMTVKFSKTISNASGWEIEYSTSKKFTKKTTKKVTVKGNKSLTKTISKLKSGKKYYVRVRGYLDQGRGEKLYGGWSKVKSIKVK